jgi:hypothetical protein
MKNSPANIDRFFEMIEDNVEKLTVWETEFIESIKAQWERYGILTIDQEKILERIYAEKTP